MLRIVGSLAYLQVSLRCSGIRTAVDVS